MSGERPAAGDGPTTYEAMIQNMGNLKRISTSVSEASDSNKKTTIEIVTLFGTIKDTILKLMTRKDVEGKAIDQMKIIHGKEMSELQGKHDEAINNANLNDEELTKLRGAIQAANENYNTNTNTIIADIMEISNNNTIITNLNDLVTQINELDALIHGKNDNPIQPLGPGDNDHQQEEDHQQEQEDHQQEKEDQHQEQEQQQHQEQHQMSKQEQKMKKKMTSVTMNL